MTEPCRLEPGDAKNVDPCPTCGHAYIVHNGEYMCGLCQIRDELRAELVVAKLEVVGPLDGRHVIVLPEADQWSDEARESVSKAVINHFTGAAQGRGETGDVRRFVPLVAFGDVRFGERVTDDESSGDYFPGGK